MSSVHLWPSVARPVTGATPPAPMTMGEVAEIRLSSGVSTSIFRTNGKPSIGVAVIKEPDANTIDVTTEVLTAIDDIGGLPPDVEVVTISNDGPEIEAQIETLEREAIIGLILTVTVVQDSTRRKTVERQRVGDRFGLGNKGLFSIPKLR